MTVFDDGPSEEAAFIALCAARRAAALRVCRRVAGDHGADVLFVELPDDAPFSPACQLTTPAGVNLAMVSSNGVATTLLVSASHAVVELPDDLDERARETMMEATLRGAIDHGLRAD